MAEEKLYLFRPTDQDMKIEYPELEKEPAFRGLGKDEMKFVWYYGNRTSPYFTPKNGESNKVKYCIKMSFKASAGGEPLPEKDYRRYLESNFPEKIKDAITAMNSYNPSARLRARFAIENAFSNLVTSLDITDEMKKEMEDDIDLRKKYIELSIKVTESLPLVTAQLEEGYGIRTSSFFGGEGKGMSVMDQLHTADTGNR